VRSSTLLNFFLSARLYKLHEAILLLQEQGYTIMEYEYDIRTQEYSFIVRSCPDNPDQLELDL
jgi:monomeric isocitrate dehydrogenase